MKKVISVLLSLITIVSLFPLSVPASAENANPYPVLEGITMYAMGDSYFGGSSLGQSVTWVNKLGNKYNMNYINYGKGGSTMSNFVTTNNPMVDRVKAMKRSKCDIVLLEGGRNDLNKEVPLGEIDSRDTKTFNGAINYMLDFLLEYYPDALIILITPWKYSSKKSNGYSNVTYADSMRSVAEHRNDKRIVCLYAADPAISGVDMDNAKFRMQNCIKADDVSHLNDEGMNYVLPYMEKFIGNAYADYLNYINPPATTEEETTAAPETTVLPEITTEDPATEPATETASDNGCGGLASFSAITLIICGACLVICKKRK